MSIKRMIARQKKIKAIKEEKARHRGQRWDAKLGRWVDRPKPYRKDGVKNEH